MKRICKVITLGAAVVASGILVNNTFAANSGEMQFSVELAPSITMTLSQNSMTLPITPSASGSFTSGSFTITTSTNSPAGYKLTMATSTTDPNDNTSLVSSTANVTDGTYPRIPSLSSASAQSGFPVNKWGAVALTQTSNNPTYGVIPSESTEIRDEDEAASNQNTYVYIGAKVDLEKPAGVYSNTITITATANIAEEKPYMCEDDDLSHDCSHDDGTTYPANSLLRAFEVAYTRAEKPMYVETNDTTHYPNGWRPMEDGEQIAGGTEVRFAMQDISMTFTDNNVTHSVCEWAAASNRNNNNYVDEALVMDLRDGKSYWIVKAEDNKCWMSQNLDLDLSSSVPLVHATSDIGWTSGNAQASWTPVTTLSSASGAGYAYYTPESYNPGDKWVVTSGNNNDDAVYTTMADCITNSTTHAQDECRHYHIGNLYNWNAATAQDSSASLDHDDNAPDSICPAGWRLPNAQGATDDYNTLLEQSGIIYGGQFNTGGLQSMRFSPLYFVRGGYVAYGDHDRVGKTGLYFTMTSGPNYGSGDTSAKTLMFGKDWSDDIFINTAQQEWGREYGQSVRCIAR